MAFVFALLGAAQKTEGLYNRGLVRVVAPPAYFEADFQPLSRAVPSSPNLPFSPAASFPPKV